MPRSQFIVFPVLALLLAGLSWGTTAIFVRVLSAKGFTSFELLVLRLAVVAVVAVLLVPTYIIWLARNRGAASGLQHFKSKTTYFIGISMVFYYLGAILAVQNLPLVLAVLLIGSSPLLAWIWPLLKQRRGPKTHELLPGLGVLIGVLGLVGFAIAKSKSLNPSFSLENTSPTLGYLSGFLSAMVTVWNSRILKAKGSDAPSPIAISIVTSSVGLLLAPLLFLSSGSHDLMSLIQTHLSLIIGFGVFATLIPGIAQAYASTHLAPVLSSTVSIQLQWWTAVFGWWFLNESLTRFQFLAAGLVLLGTLLCLFGSESGSRFKYRR